MTKYADMSMSPAEAAEMSGPVSMANTPKYPYGLCISLGKDELEKLGLDHTEIEVSDFLHVHALAKVTSKSNCETESGENPRVELCLCFMEIEDEGMEDEEEEVDEPKSVTKRLYK